MKHGMPQSSILGPILFNIFLCDIFFMIDNVDIASYADDLERKLWDVERKLKKTSVKLFK